MQHQTKFSIIFLSFLFSISTHASGYLSPLASNGVSISSYFVHSSGAVTLMLNSVTPSNPDSCAVTTRVHLKGNLDGHQNMVAAALAAFASGKKVGLYSSGCESIPFWGGNIQTPIISNLWVFN